jgi:hypothetical protein
VSEGGSERGRERTDREGPLIFYLHAAIGTYGPIRVCHAGTCGRVALATLVSCACGDLRHVRGTATRSANTRRALIDSGTSGKLSGIVHALEVDTVLTWLTDGTLLADGCDLEHEIARCDCSFLRDEDSGCLKEHSTVWCANGLTGRELPPHTDRVLTVWVHIGIACDR